MSATLRALLSPRGSSTPREKSGQDLLKEEGYGVLAVKLSKAHGVKPSDDNGLADPYVRFVHGGKKFVSEVCRRTIHPVWEGKKAKLVLKGKLEELVQTPLAITVYDRDMLGRDTDLGSAIVKLPGGSTLDKLDPVGMPKEVKCSAPLFPADSSKGTQT